MAETLLLTWLQALWVRSCWLKKNKKKQLKWTKAAESALKFPTKIFPLFLTINGRAGVVIVDDRAAKLLAGKISQASHHVDADVC